MTDEDFRFIQQLAYKHCGINLQLHKQEMVYSRLCRRLRTLHMLSFSQYCHYLAKHYDELELFINALTTNQTAFFRESHHFEFLQNQMIPIWQMKKQKKIRIWSAACSTGEEACSIAITLANHISLINYDIKILATDVNTQVLHTAEHGIYPLSSLAKIPQKYQTKTIKLHNDYFEIKNNLKSIIYYKKLNLLDNWPLKYKFDAIFCRNVLIYFNAENRKVLIHNFRSQLKDDGHLFIGHSESLNAISSEFKSLGKSIYKPSET